jgi:hemerythrin-like domain-containing protein
MSIDRRRFLATSTPFSLIAAGAAPAWISGRALAREAPKKEEPEEEISAPEDLMREHGALNRILLVYEEVARRIRAGQPVAPDIIHRPAEIARKFVEDYHERLEEQFIFPEFEKHKNLTELVAVLRQQHDAGRRVTDRLLQATQGNNFGDAARRAALEACDAYVRMYRPHEAREDTVLFPALYELLGSDRVRELGKLFEEEEQRRLGEGGFAKTVAQIADIEKQLGIYDLAQFTPR